MASKYALKTKNCLGDKCHSNSTGPSYIKKTDTEGWHLVATQELGRLKWVYMNDKEERKAHPQDDTTKFFLDIPIVCLTQLAPLGWSGLLI